MCEIFIRANPESYVCQSRSLRLHGVATSIRLEKLFWEVLAELAQRDGMSVSQLIARLYDELAAHRGEVANFSSFLRVCCLRYLMLQGEGRIPADPRVPIRSLDAAAVLRDLPPGWVDTPPSSAAAAAAATGRSARRVPVARAKAGQLPA
ncbi:MULTISPECIES: ribbon-helix-helix domain-containing protein [Cupriavidus]|uniref:ribbon-helix-helix domain-containing protein n=1 Tax=Cupriavidus TaxID=106589 RepID=UPI0009F69CB6|nr:MULTISPECIES: ribbon-helix-helix domain-containing protein [Cupriavidus]